MADDTTVSQDTTNDGTTTEAGKDTSKETQTGEDTSTDGEGSKKETPGEETLLSDKGEKAAEEDNAAKAEDTKGDDADGDDDEAEAVVYEDFVIPEGTEASEADITDFKGLVGTFNDGKGISQEDAQKLIDFEAKRVKDQTAEWDERFSEWRGEIAADDKLGGKNLETKTIPNVLKAVETYGDKDMMDLVKKNKMYGDNPSLIRLLNNVGEALAEDKLSRGKPAKEKKDAATTLYPNQDK